MESDCTIIMQSMDHPMIMKQSSKSSRLSASLRLIRYVIFYLTVSWTVSPACSIFVDCDTVNAEKKCICTKHDIGSWAIECSDIPMGFQSEFIYPVALNVQTDKSSGDANVAVKCNPQQAEFKWELIKGVDLSPPKIGAMITKIVIEYCPIVDDGLEGLLSRMNISGDQLRKLTFSSTIRNISTVPLNFFSQMKNLEVVIFRKNQLIEVPDLSLLPKLKELNLRDNKLQNIPPQAFLLNNNLESVALSGNKLNQLESSVFPESIKSLDLSRNQIMNLTKQFFSRLKNLETLQLDTNPLTEMSQDAFDDLKELRILHMNNVQLSSFPAFRNLPQLTNLSMNFLKESPSNTSLVLENLPSLGTLEMRNSNIQTLPTILNVPKLMKVNLKGNKIQTLSSEFFIQAQFLVSMDLSENLIEDLVEIKSSRLEWLDLSRNQITSLQREALRHLNRLLTLNLSRNKITTVDYFAFEYLGSLQNLDLSRNDIEFGKSPFVNSPDSNFMGFGDISSYSPLHQCSNLRKLNLSFNRIDTIYEDWRMSKLSLSNLDLSYNKITNITAIDLDFITKGLELNLTQNEISFVNLDQYWILLESKPSNVLINVYLDGNPLDCNCSAYLIKSFNLHSHRLHFDGLMCHSPENLQDKLLKNVSDHKLLCQLTPESKNCLGEKCQCWKRPVDETIVADCSRRGFTNEELKGLDWKLSKEFRRWNAELNLSENHITEFKTDVLSNLPNRTRFIDLSGNKLTSISFITSLQENATVDLANNPFACDSCSDFVLLWAAYSNKIKSGENTTCIKKSANELEPSEHVTIQDIVSLAEDCKPVLTGEIRTLIIVVAVLAVFCVLLIIVVFRYAWVIKAYLYSKGLGCCLFWDRDFDAEDEEKLYDAFVSYSHKDEEFVIEELVNRLEDKEGFKLCLHFRDWTPGDWIPDQIVKSVDQSKRTVVILSKNFVESVWSRLEFKAAHAQALSQRSNRVIVVLLGDDLKEKDVQDDDLRVYMKMNTYLKWNDPWFWHKLKYALPHRKNHEENQDMLRKMEQRERAIHLDKLRAKLEQTV